MNTTSKVLVTGSMVASALLMGGTAFAADSTVTSAHVGGGMMGARGHAPGVFGTVSAINGNTITLTSKPRGDIAPTTYTVNAAAATVTKNNAASTVSGIAVGDTIMVQGTVTGTTVTATTIRDGVMPGRGKGADGAPGTMPKSAMPMMQGNGQPIVGGSVSAISGSTLTLTTAQGGNTYTVNAATAKVLKGNATSTLASVSVGDKVVVQGTVSGNAVTATTIVDQGTLPAGAPTDTNGAPEARRGGFMGAVQGFFHNLFGFF